MDGLLALKKRALTARIFVQQGGSKPERILDPLFRIEQADPIFAAPDSMFVSLGPGESLAAELLLLVDWATRKQVLPEKGKCMVWATLVVPERRAYSLLWDPRVGKERIEKEALDPAVKLEVGVWGPDYLGAIKKRALLRSNTLEINVEKPSTKAERKALSLIQSCAKPLMICWPELLPQTKGSREEVAKIKQLYLMKEKTPYHSYARIALTKWKDMEKEYRKWKAKSKSYRGRLHDLGLGDLEIENLPSETTEPRSVRRARWPRILLQAAGIVTILALSFFLLWRRRVFRGLRGGQA